MVLSMGFLMLLVLGTIEVALALYGRDVVAAAAHEGARAAVELGRDPADARFVAQRTVRRASGSLVRDLAVKVSTHATGSTSYVRVRIAGWLRPLGPIPFAVPVSAVATVAKGVHPR
jgi:TadE-like protein